MNLTLCFSFIYLSIFQMPPRRTPEEIAELRRAHREAYNAKHNPKTISTDAYPFPNRTLGEKLRTKEEVEKKFGKLPTQTFQSNKAKGNPTTGKFTTSEFKYSMAKHNPNQLVKESEVYNPVERYVSQRFKKKNKPSTNPKIELKPGKSPFYSREKSSKKRKQIGVGHGGVRKKQKRE